MVDLATLANIAEVAGLAALVGGAIFAIYQIREARISRETTSALTVLREFLRDENFFTAINHLMQLPDDWAEDPILGEDPEAIRVAERVYLAMEMLGYFVFAGAVRLEDVRNLGGGGIHAGWKKVEGYANKARRTRGAHAFEWFEWLAVQLERHGISDQTPLEAFPDWKP